MKSKMTLSLVLTLSVALSLVSLPYSAQGQQMPRRFSARSGVVTPGMGQGLRVVVLGNGGNDTIRVRFAWRQYMTASCSGAPPVCRHIVSAEGTTAAETVGDDAVSFDAPLNGGGVNVTVFSNSRNVVVRSIVFDTSTQRIMATWDMTLE